jgi:hypothetical protein
MATASALLLVIFAGFSTASEAAETKLAAGDRLPALSGDFLSGRKAVLPQAAASRVALLAAGFTYESRHAVDAWVGRFRREFSGNPGVTFFEIPMIGGLGRLGRWFIDSGMRKGTPKELHENVITVYGGTDPWKKRLGYKEPDAAYLVLVDRDGIVRWLHTGNLEESAFAELSRRVRELLK